MSSPPKRRRGKKARPNLQPTSSPELSRSGSNDEFGFTDVVLTKERAGTRKNAGPDVSSSLSGNSSELSPSLMVTTLSLTNAFCEGGKVAMISSLKAAASTSAATTAAGEQSGKILTKPSLTAKTIQSEPDVVAMCSYDVVLDKKNRIASSLKMAVCQSKTIAKSSDNRASETESEIPTAKQLFATTQSETSRMISSPIQSGLNYASHYFSSPAKTPDTAKTQNTTETSSMTQIEEEDAEMLESIQQPVFDVGSEAKSTPTKTKLIDVFVATSTPVVSNVTSSILTVDTINQEETMSEILFSPERNATPKTPYNDRYDIFGFDLRKSESAKKLADEKSGASVVKPLETVRPVNLEQNYNVSIATADNRTEILRTPVIELADKREEAPSSTKSCSRQSSVSLSEVVQDSVTSMESEHTATVHLLRCENDPRQEEQHSCSDSDEASFSSSDGEMSYFSESRASTAIPSTKMPASYPPNLPMRTHIHPQSTSFGVRNPIEMKLSLSISEDDHEESRGNVAHEELIWYKTYSPTKDDSFGSIVESATSVSDGEDQEHSKPLVSKKTHSKSNYSPHAMSTPLSNTSGSTDDAGVVSELSAYLISSKIEAANVQLSGRVSPVGGGHVKSALKRKTSNYSETPTPTSADGARYIYADVQSAVTAAKSKPGAHRPTSSWDTSSFGGMQSNLKAASKLTQVHSPGGAFSTNARSPYTPEVRVQPSTGLHSLAYSEDKEDPNEKTTSPFVSLREINKEFDEEIAACNPELKYGVYSLRWGILFCVSVLNLLAGWICFSGVPIASFADIKPQYLVSIFLLASCWGCVMEPIVLGRLGMRKTVVFGALLLMLGSLINSDGVSLFFDNQDDNARWRLYSGFSVAGFSQPFYQYTISIITNAWFPGSERRLASAITLNCYHIGILLSFAFGSCLVKSDDDIASYFQLICLVSVLTFCLVAFMVDDAPPLPPPKRRRSKKQPLKKSLTLRKKKSSANTESNVENPLTEGDNPLDIETGDTSKIKKQEEQLLVETKPLTRMSSPLMTSSYGSTEHNSTITSSNSSRQNHDYVEPIVSQKPYNLDITIRCDQIWLATKMCFSFKGFSHCSIVYIAAGIVLNTLSTFMGDLVQLNGAPNIYVGFVGGGFQLLVMASSLIFTKCFKNSHEACQIQITMSLLVLGGFALLMCSSQLGYKLGLDACILVVAVLVGPLQSLSTCLGSKVARPLNESTVLNIHRLYSNLFSAATIPMFGILRHYSVTTCLETHDFDLSFYLLIITSASSAIYFGFFVRSSTLPKGEKTCIFSRTGADFQDRNMVILPNRRFPQQPYKPWVPPGQRKARADYPFLVLSS